MKKILPTIVTGALLLSMAVPALAAETPTNPFSDINGSFAKDAIIQLQKEGILTGMDTEHFDPKGSLTRAQFIVIMVKSLNLPIDKNAVSSFTDVEGWAVPYIEAAKKYGIIDGVSDTTFAPNATLTREQSAVVMVKALQKQGKIEDSAELTIPDADSVSDWAKKYVALAFKYKLVSGNEDGSFNPQGTASREQAAQMGSNFIEGVKEVKKDNLETKPEPTPTVKPTVTPAPTTTPAPVVSGGDGGNSGGGNTTTASSIAITAANISNAVSGTQFNLNVTARGTVGTDHSADKVRYYVSIAGLTSHDIVVNGVSTVVVQEGTSTLPLILGVGDSAGVTLGSLTSQYAIGITTPYPVTINKVGNYTFNYSLKTVATNSITISTGASTVAVVAASTNHIPAPIVLNGVSIRSLTQSESSNFGDTFSGGIKVTVTNNELPDTVKDFRYIAQRGSSAERANINLDDLKLFVNERTIEKQDNEVFDTPAEITSYDQAWALVIFYDADKNPIGYYQTNPIRNFYPAKFYYIKLLESRTLVDEAFINDVHIARTTYDNLSHEQQALVTNYNVLTAAEALIANPTLDLASINTAITAANVAKNGVVISADGKDVAPTSKWVTQAVNDALVNAITAASTAKTTATTAKQVTDAAAALNEAVTTYVAAEAAGTQVNTPVVSDHGVSMTNLTEQEVIAARTNHGSSASGGIKFVITNSGLPNDVKDYKYISFTGSSDERTYTNLSGLALSPNQTTYERGDSETTAVWAFPFYSYTIPWYIVAFYDADKNPIGYYQKNQVVDFFPAELPTISALVGRDVDSTFIDDVHTARRDYNFLLPAQKVLVSNYTALVAAEMRIAALVTLDKSELEAELVVAADAKRDVVVSTDGLDVSPTSKWVTQTKLDELNVAIATATSVKTTATTQQELIDATTVLNSAVEVFNSAKTDGTKVVVPPVDVQEVSSDGIVMRGFTEEEVMNVRLYYGEASSGLKIIVTKSELSDEIKNYKFYTVRGSGIKLEKNQHDFTLSGNEVKTSSGDTASTTWSMGIYDYSIPFYTITFYDADDKPIGFYQKEIARTFYSAPFSLISNLDREIDATFAHDVAYAREIYDGMTDYQKNLITNYQVLLDAEAKLEGGGTGTPTRPIPTSLAFTAIDTNATVN